MKKLLISAFAIAAIITGVSAISQSESHSKNIVSMINIEALTNGETSGPTVMCYCKSKLFSPNICSANASGTYCGGDPCSNHDGNCR